MPIQREIQSAGLSALATQGILGSQNLTVSAAGATQATATALAAAVNIVTTCTLTANGVILPVNQPPDTIVVANASANTLYVYPPVGGALGGATVNIPLALPPGVSEDFIQTSSVNYST